MSPPPPRPRGRGGSLAAAVVVLALASVAHAALGPGRLAVLDAFADPFGQGHFGALFEADPHGPPADPATPLSSTAGFYQASDLAFREDGSLVIADRDADPSGFGPDANGDPGPGAVFVADGITQALTPLADGSDYPAGIPPPARSIFVDPRGIAVLPDGITALVADTDADPSGLGPDTAGFAGHGALFSVDAGGTVRLVSDGTLSDDGPPPRGAASWLQDPGSACVASDGRVYLLDLFGDPLSTGGRGAVFRVDVGTGRLSLVGVSSQFVGPAAVTERSPGLLVVTDQLADLRGDGSRGALFAIDLLAPDPVSAVSVLATDARFRGPAGLGHAPDGSLFVADPFADPLELSRIGAIFRVRPDGDVSVASEAPGFLAPTSVRLTRPTQAAPSLASISPAAAEAASSVTVTLAGNGLEAEAETRWGPGVSVAALRLLSATAAEADLVVDAAAAPGPRDVTWVNGDLQASTLPAAFEVLPRSRPEVQAVAPSAGIQGTRVRVSVSGLRFADGASLDAGAGVVASSVTWMDAGLLQADLDVAVAAALGPRDVVVTNPDGLDGRLAGAFEVLPPEPPLPTAVAPSTLAPGRATDVVVDGTGFVPGMRLDAGTGVTAGPVAVESPFRARAKLFARADATPGVRDLTATNPDSRSGTLAGGILVEDRPSLRLVAVRVDDAAGNASGAADPGETIAFDVLAWSDGPRPLASAVLRITSPPGSGGLMTRSSVVLGASGPGLLRRAAPPLPEMLVDDATPCGAAIPVRVEILEGAAVLLDATAVVAVGETASVVRKPALTGASTGARGGAAVALADLDGDGAADLVSGAPRETPGGLFAAGLVAAVSGSTDDPLWSLVGTVADGRLGSAIAPVGDVDGDGGTDLVVGAPGLDSGDGRVLLVSGRDGSVLRSFGRAGLRGLGSALALLGDRDLDGAADVLAGAARGAGSAIVLRLPGLDEIASLDGAPGDELGAAVAPAGDLDGDGLADAALGAPGLVAGRVLLWRGDGSVTSLLGVESGERFGAALAGGADADGDGVADLAAGAPSASTAGASSGRVEWISGRDGSRRSLPGSGPGAEAGTALAFAGDLDGDGLSELAVGLPGAAAGDGRVELRRGDLSLARSEAGAAGEAARFGESLAAGTRAGGDAISDLAAGAPLQDVPGTLQAGRAVLLKTVSACEPAVACTADAREPNPPATPSLLGYGFTGGLRICPADLDAFRIALLAGTRASVVVRFAHAQGDLDAVLLDAAGTVVEQSLSVDDDEELGPFGPGGTWDVVVSGYDGATNGYAIEVLDPDRCIPASEITGLRVRRSGGSSLLTWDASSDPCHATPPDAGYRVWQAPGAAPTGAGGFPAGSAFVDVTALDRDGDASNPAHESASGGPVFWLVTDRGRSGDDGPSGWPAR